MIWHHLYLQQYGTLQFYPGKQQQQLDHHQAKSTNEHIKQTQIILIVCLFCCFTSQSTAMVMAGRSVDLTTLFLDKLEQAVNQYFVHILLHVTDNNPS